MLKDNANEIVIWEHEVTPNNYSSHHKCILLSECFKLKVFSESYYSFKMTVHVDVNQIIPEVSVGIGNKKFSFSYFNNTMIQNRYEAYQLCDVIFEPNTKK